MGDFKMIPNDEHYLSLQGHNIIIIIIIIIIESLNHCCFIHDIALIIIKIKNNINIKSKPVIVFHCCWPFWIQKWVYAGSGG